VEVKDQQKKHWNAVADGWAAWFDWTEQNFSAVTDWFRDAADWKPGGRILDVGCGSGFPALAAAASIRPGGSVVATDISPEMLAVASSRANADGLDNIEFVEMDAEQLKFDDAEFDAVTNAYGLMFCPDVPRAFREAHRVLRPGGRFALVTWDDPSQSPFFSVITPVAVPFLSLQPPDLAAPGPFRLSSPSQLELLLSEAGFSDVRVESVAMTLELASAAEYLQIFSDVAWKARVASLSDPDLARFREAVAEAARPYVDEVSGRLRLVATSLCASGRR
jgi:ubiquinone/menaquinone biosynthesis C-methylase UbiE